jgi:hypothetical protein
MAWSKSERQITWGGSNTISVSAGGSQVSDKITFNPDTVNAYIKCKADNGSTPASGDTVDLAAQFGGDPDGDGTEDMDNQGDFLVNLDTDLNDPAVASPTMPFAPQGEDMQLEATNNSGQNTITVSAVLVEERWS